MATTTGASALDRSKRWVEPAARTGLATKGVLYMLIGGLAIAAAIGAGGQIAGGQEATRTIGEQPFGQFLLALTGLGLIAYAAWRFVEAILDPEHEARQGTAMLKRAAWALSGIAHGSLGIAALQMAFGRASGTGGGRQAWISSVMSWEIGPFLVMLAGLGVIAFGIHQLVRAWTLDFARNLELHEMSPTARQWAVRAGRIGIFARGVVFVVVGGGLIQAGLQRQPGEANGLGGALQEIASRPWGMALLGLIAVGLVAYGIHQLVEARYRRIHLPA